MTGPPKLDSNMTIGVSTNRGPISVKESLVSPFLLFGDLTAMAISSVVAPFVASLEVISVSLIWKHRIHIFPSASVNPMTWSMKGLIFREVLGTPNMCVRSSLTTRRYGCVLNVESKESMGRLPLRQLPGKCNSDIV